LWKKRNKMTREQGESTAPSCSVSGGNRSRGAAATSETNAINERGEHNIFGGKCRHH
jgi:hypothetical protein